MYDLFTLLIQSWELPHVLHSNRRPVPMVHLSLLLHLCPHLLRFQLFLL